MKNNGNRKQNGTDKIAHARSAVRKTKTKDRNDPKIYFFIIFLCM